MFAAVVLAVAAGPLATAAQPVQPSPVLLGIATRVLDGDSMIVRTIDDAAMSIRISAIDAPERTQPWSDASRRYLRELIEGRMLRIEPLKRDVYHRTVARVLLADGPMAGRDVGLLMVSAGLAWHFTRYAQEQPPEERAAYRQAEHLARQRHRGLWRDPRPIAPWDFRSLQREDRKATRQAMPREQ